MVTEFSSAGSLLKEFNLLRLQKDDFDSGTESDKDLCHEDQRCSDTECDNQFRQKCAKTTSQSAEIPQELHLKQQQPQHQPQQQPKQTDLNNFTIANLPAISNLNSNSNCDYDKLMDDTDNDWELEEIFTRSEQAFAPRRQCVSSGRLNAHSIDEGFLEDCPEPLNFCSTPPEGLSHCFTLSPSSFMAYSSMDFEIAK